MRICLCFFQFSLSFWKCFFSYLILLTNWIVFLICWKKLEILNLMLIQVKVDLGEDINMYTLASFGFKPGKLFCSVFSRLQISSGSLIDSVSIKENSSSVWIIYIFTTTDSGKNV